MVTGGHGTTPGGQMVLGGHGGAAFATPTFMIAPVAKNAPKTMAKSIGFLVMFLSLCYVVTPCVRNVEHSNWFRTMNTK